MLCQSSRVGLAGLLCLGICADASSAPPMLLGMSGIASLIALVLMIFGLDTLSSFNEAHGAMRSLMWHENQKSVCAMILAIVKEAQT